MYGTKFLSGGHLASSYSRNVRLSDADAVDEWRNTLSKMQDIATFVISEKVDEFRKIGPKADVGDWIVMKRFKMRGSIEYNA